jgi:hypothetical protein
MTGQVKEDVLTRKGELGIKVKQGELNFQPTLLNKNQVIQNVMDNDFVVVRNSLLAKNEIREIDLDKLSEDIRNYSLSKNSLEDKIPTDYSSLRIRVINTQKLREEKINSILYDS